MPVNQDADSIDRRFAEIDQLRIEIDGLRQRLELPPPVPQDITAKLAEVEERLRDFEDVKADLAQQKVEFAGQISQLRTDQERHPTIAAQHEHSEIGALGVDVNNLTTGLGQIQERVTKAETKLDSHEKGLIGFFQKTGIIIGVLGAVLAGVTGFLGLPKAFKEYQSKPQTKLVTGWPLELSYDPTAKRVAFVFSAKLANDGGKADTIKQISASFRANATPADQAQFFASGIKFSEKEVPLNAPFEVGTSSPREFLCTTTTDLGSNDVRVFLQPGINHLKVTLIGDDGKERASANYCFWVMKTHVDQMAAATNLTTITYVAEYPGCEPRN